jgi:cardiolipin synthase
MNFANKISTFRILSVPFFVASLLYSSQKPLLRAVATFIFVLAVISDAVDGYIARKAKQISQAGAVLDPLGDKLLLMSAFICLVIAGEFPFWLMFIIISRDAIILLGTLVIYLVKEHIDVYPSNLGKITTALQMLTVLAVLTRVPFALCVAWIAVLFTVISGTNYVKRGFRILYADNSRNTH